MKKVLSLVLIIFVSLGSAFGANAISLIENTTFKGDFNFIFEVKDRKTTVERMRERIRFRYGFETKVSDKIMVGARFSSGSTSCRSTNQDLTNSFQSKGVYLDKAYLKFTPIESLNIFAGKYSEALMIVDDLLWDSDITFEGQTICYKKQIFTDTKLFVKSGWLMIEEISNSIKDPSLGYMQSGLLKKSNDGVSYKTGIAYYYFKEVKGNILTGSSGSNSVDFFPYGLKYDYNAINVNGSITFKKRDCPYALTVLGDYITNPDPDDIGYLAGLKFGHSKLNENGKWNVYYNYRYLEKDAFLDAFPDASAFSGATGVKGSEFIINYALSKKVCMGFDYYNMRQNDNSLDQENVFQTNVLVKF